MLIKKLTRSELIGGTERELERGHVDTRQVDTTGREPRTRVLGKRVAVDVLPRGARKVQLRVDDTEEERATRLLTLRTVELDGGSADRVITKVVRALVVEVVQSSLVGLLLHSPEQARHGVVEHHTRVNLGGTGRLGVEVRHLHVTDEVLMGIRREQAALHRVQKHEVGDQRTIGDLTSVRAVQTSADGSSVGGVGVDEQLILAAQLTLDTNVVVLQSNDGQGLRPGTREPEGQLHPELGDRVGIRINSVTVVSPINQLSLRLGPEHQLIHIHVHVRLELLLQLQVLSRDLVDLVVTNLHGA